MHLSSLIAEAERKLDPTKRASLLLAVAGAVLPALRELPVVLAVAKDLVSLASQWTPNGSLKAEDLYGCANTEERNGLAFQEAAATTVEERAAIIAVTMAYYYTVWCAYIFEGTLNVPEDVEAVPTEAFQGVFEYAVDSAAIRESQLCDLLKQHIKVGSDA